MKKRKRKLGEKGKKLEENGRYTTFILYIMKLLNKPIKNE